MVQARRVVMDRISRDKNAEWNGRYVVLHVNQRSNQCCFLIFNTIDDHNIHDAGSGPKEDEGAVQHPLRSR